MDGYQMSVDSLYGFGIGNLTKPVSEGQIVLPSEMIAITDAATNFEFPLGIVLPGQSVSAVTDPFFCVDSNNGWPASNTPDPFAHIIQKPPQHGRNFNVLFCDGHVSRMRVTDLT